MIFNPDFISRVGYTLKDDFFNHINLLYKYDSVTGLFNNSITLIDRGSVSYYGKTIKKTLEAPGCFSQESALALAKVHLYLNSAPRFFVSFDYENIMLENPLEVGVGYITSKFMPSYDGSFNNKKGIITFLQRRDEVYTVNLDIVDRYAEFKPDTIAISTVFGIIKIEGVRTKTLSFVGPNNSPIEGLTIVVDGQTRLTDLNGQVSFKLNPGVYRVQVSGPGYEKTTFTVRVEI